MCSGINQLTPEIPWADWEIPGDMTVKGNKGERPLSYVPVLAFTGATWSRYPGLGWCQPGGTPLDNKLQPVLSLRYHKATWALPARRTTSPPYSLLEP